jgi:hypothetical protein
MESGLILLFVYNIDRGNLSAMADYHKSTPSGKTHPCNLFALIYSPVGMKKGWKRFISELGILSKFLYRDEFFLEIGMEKHSFPAVYIQSGKSFQEIIAADEINRMDSTESLIGLVTQRLVHYKK